METPAERGLFHQLYLKFIPFWLFRDASRGNFLLREQNYRYNREQRKLLPGYLFKWSILCSFLLGSYELAHTMGQSFYAVREVLVAWEVFSGVSFSVGVALMSKIAAIWGYLTFVR
jgi:hypothetical protein